MLQRELNRAANLFLDAVNTTALHLRRIVWLASTVVTGTTREVEDLVWDYQDLAGDLRDGVVTNDVDNVIHLDARRRASRYRGAS